MIEKEIVGQISRSLANGIDEVLGDAVTRLIGSGWTIESLEGRLHSRLLQNGTLMFSLDGKNIAELYPLQSDEALEDGAAYIKTRIPYRVLIEKPS